MFFLFTDMKIFIFLIPLIHGIYIPVIFDTELESYQPPTLDKYQEARKTIDQTTWPINTDPDQLSRLNKGFESIGVIAVWVPTVLWEVSHIMNYIFKSRDEDTYESLNCQNVDVCISSYGKIVYPDHMNDKYDILRAMDSFLLSFFFSLTPKKVDGLSNIFCWELDEYKKVCSKVFGELNSWSMSWLLKSKVEEAKNDKLYGDYPVKIHFYHLLIPELERYIKKQPLIIEIVIELEYNTFLKDEFLFFRGTQGCPLFKEPDGNRIRALDSFFWLETRPMVFQSPPPVKGTFIKPKDLSYGVSLFAGGLRDSGMSEVSACTIRFTTINSGFNAKFLLYALRFPAIDMVKIKKVFFIPNVPLHEGIFSRGELFHGRGKISESSLSYESTNNLLEIGNDILAKNSVVLWINDRVVTSQTEEAVKLILIAQSRLLCLKSVSLYKELLLNELYSIVFSPSLQVTPLLFENQWIAKRIQDKAKYLDTVVGIMKAKITENSSLQRKDFSSSDMDFEETYNTLWMPVFSIAKVFSVFDSKYNFMTEDSLPSTEMSIRLEICQNFLIKYKKNGVNFFTFTK